MMLATGKSDAPPPAFSVVVVSWNPGPLVDDVLRALDGQTLAQLEVVWVDNGSTDESWEQFRRHRFRPGIVARGVALRQNRGVAAGRMAGIGAATGEVLGFLDVDAVPAPDWADAALAVMAAHPDWGVAASWVVFPDGRLNGFGARLDRWGHGFDDGYGLSPTDPFAPGPTPGPTDYAMGCGMIVRASLARQLDLDPLPVKWHDDSELALQARALGFSVGRHPALQVVHHQGQSDPALSARFGRSHRASRFYLAERARVRLLWKYYPWSAVLAGGVADAVTAVRSARDPAVAGALCRAHWWNAVHVRSAVAYRRRWRGALAAAGWPPRSGRLAKPRGQKRQSQTE